jgi:hypothetical protein
VPALTRAVPLLVAACAAPSPLSPPPWCDAPAPASEATDRSLALVEGAAWCTLPDETRGAAADLAGKARVVVPGADVPVGVGPVPACVARAAEGAGLVATGDASWRVEEVPGVAWVATAVQALVGPSGEAGALTLRVRAPEAVREVALDGTRPDFDDDVAIGWTLEVEGAERGLDACAFPDVPRSRHHVAFEGGEVDLELRIASSLVGTQPSVFERAAGVIDGEAFTTTDPWSLGYGPTHHHVDRSFLVRLPAPIGAIAALEVRHADPDGAEPPVEVDLLDAAGEIVRSPAVLAEAHEVAPP